MDLRHQVVKEDDDEAALVVGSQDWPINELQAIQVSLAYVDAQNDYIDMNPEKSDPPAYAQKFISSEGRLMAGWTDFKGT